MSSTFGDFGSLGLGLPIAPRGLFFQDAFFPRTRDSFRTSVHDVLANYDLQQLPFVDSLQRYKDPRCDNQRKESQGVSAIEDDKNYKMILDVRDFMGGDLKVNSIDDNELLVEGKIEKMIQGKMQTQTFKQKFLLPEGVDIQGTSSSLSPDGILTVITPKINQHQETIPPQQQQELPVHMRPNSMHTSNHFDRNSYSLFDTELNSGMMLPILRRGYFNQDLSFQEAQKDFKWAVNDALARSGLQSADPITSYRDLRAKDLKEETQATSVSEDDQAQKIVIDMQDFMNDGEVNVKVVNDKELVVVGRKEKNCGGSTSMKNFKKQFTIPPNTELDSISSVLSADGVLVITIPKKAKVPMVKEHQTPLIIEGPRTSQPSSYYQESVHPQHQELPMKMRPKTMNSNGHIDRNRNSLFGTEFNSGMMLPIMKRGHFNQDLSFQEAQKDFQCAINDALARSGLQSADPITSYRDLRAKDLKEETQAATVSEDDQAQKIIIDVQDFMNDGEVNVKVVNDKELVVVGRKEKNFGGSMSMKNFKKQFTIPPNTELDSISSVVSADGVLVITIPKKHQESVQPQQQELPIKMRPKTMNSNSHIDRNRNSLFDTEFNSGMMLPIMKRGYFNQDLSFQESQKDFQCAINDALARSGLQSADPIKSYRDLRAKDLKEETQAATVSEDDQAQKIVIDVQDFMNDGEVNVKVVNEKELVVVGRKEKNFEGSTSMKNFKKQFTIPSNTELDSISTVVSADGVLVITIPKKNKGNIIPISQEDEYINAPSSRVDKEGVAHGQATRVDASTSSEPTIWSAFASLVSTAPVIPRTTISTSISPTILLDKKSDTLGQTTLVDASTSPEPTILSEISSLISMAPVIPGTTISTSISPTIPLDKGAATLGQATLVDASTSPELTNLSAFSSLVSMATTIPRSTITPYISPTIILDKEANTLGQAKLVDASTSPDPTILSPFTGLSATATVIPHTTISPSISPTNILNKEADTLGQAILVDATTSPEATIRSAFTSLVSTASAIPVTTISPTMTPPILTPTLTPPVSPPAPTRPVLRPTLRSSVAPSAPIVPVFPTDPTTPVCPLPWSTVMDSERQSIIDQLKDKEHCEPEPFHFPDAEGFVPVAKKGDFETDPHFENDKQDYNSAIKIALKCKGTEVLPGEEKATYKKMLKQSNNDEDVAFSFTQHNQGYKIVLDMEDYNVKDPEIQIHGEHDIFIVGVAERKDENGEPINFRRQFIFPKSVNMETITSAVSTDGILTVKTPFKGSNINKGIINEPSDYVEGDDDTGGLPLKMLVGTFLDIENRPDLFDKDPLFQESKCHYLSAIRAAIKRSGATMRKGETETRCYRRMRDIERVHKTQAVMTIEADYYYKVIVDMEAYMETEIKIRLLGFNTFVVECYQEMNGKSKRNWSRQFVLPNHIQMEKMTATLSVDGKLVLNVPKRVWKHVGNTDASGIMRVDWMKTVPDDDRVFTSDSCKSGVTHPCITLPFKGLGEWL
ncbi:unnamed protein product [Meganyctiphanes norvegica]|uniref:SHSP domain-containing protein n=1 Tax=Meganyctiphanes norvegica TaxID=48144 RepID=A0AAV2PI81_MEGNR